MTLINNKKNKFSIRCRAVIIDRDELLVVRHKITNQYVALPGGHLEAEEDLNSCIIREIIEELGITPDIDRLQYINQFKYQEQNTIEFIFRVNNSSDYRYINVDKCSHAHELAEILWLKKFDNINLLPNQIQLDFNNNQLPQTETKFIKN